VRARAGHGEAAATIEHELGGRDARIEGTVRVSAPSGIVPLLAGVFVELRREHPGLLFELVVDTASVALIKREADIAVRMFKPAQPSLVARRIAQLPWALFASPEYLRRHGTPPRDLEGHDVVVPAPAGVTHHATLPHLARAPLSSSRTA
jgi:DNA-binding transcriptional LysR family regulator